MTHSSRSDIAQKPYPDYPLTPRRDGRWCKRIKGTLYTFTGSAQEALDEYNRVRDDLYAGRKPRAKSEGLTVLELATKFLEAKQLQQQAGEITVLTWKDYKATCKRIVAYFGQSRTAADLQPEDFEGFRSELSKTRKLVALGNEIRRARVMFKYGFDAGLLAAPMRFGPMFRQPSTKTIKRLRAQQRSEGQGRDFTAAEIHKLLKFATPQLRAMILLGVNAGYGNHDVARLPLKALDLESGWIDHARPKTGAARRCPLWPETVKAIKEVLSKRRTPKDPSHTELVFITAALGSFWKETTDNPISKEFAKFADDCGLKRRGRSFYALRHVFRTIGAGAKDVEAVKHIMGHSESDIDDAYTESRPSDDRLLAVANHVRAWLYAKPAKGSTGTSKATEKVRTPRTSKGKSTPPDAVAEGFQLRIVG